MANTNSVLYQLIEMRMGVKLVDYVGLRRGEGASWETIARDVVAASGQVLTSETLRLWFVESERQSV
jgi:hypothetical protein